MGGVPIVIGLRAASLDFVLERLGIEWDPDLLDAVKLYVPEMLKMFAHRTRRAMTEQSAMQAPGFEA